MWPNRGVIRFWFVLYIAYSKKWPNKGGVLTQWELTQRYGLMPVKVNHCPHNKKQQILSALRNQYACLLVPVRKHLFLVFLAEDLVSVQVVFSNLFILVVPRWSCVKQTVILMIIKPYSLPFVFVLMWRFFNKRECYIENKQFRWVPNKVFFLVLVISMLVVSKMLCCHIIVVNFVWLVKV